MQVFFISTIVKINTFASQRLLFEDKNEQFLLENASNLTHDFLYDNLKLLYKNSLVTFDPFSKRNGSFFSSKTRR